MEPVLRPPLAGDYAALAGWVPDAAACLRWAGPLLTFPLAAADLPQQLAIGGGTSWCLAQGGSPALAFGQHRVVTPGAVHLARIIVSPGARGRGLGRLLCRRLIAQAIGATGAAVVTLRVYRDNAAAMALYASLGFQPLEAESNPDVLFMALRA